MPKAVIALALSTLALSGCLRKEAVHTLYLSPDGSVRWVASESNVYSDEEDPGRRFAEEQAYIGPALIGTHTVAAALDSLQPAGLVETLVIRDERPFHVVTQAPFARIDQVFVRMLRELGLDGTAGLTSAGGSSTLRVTVDFSREKEQKPTPLGRMLEDMVDLRIIMIAGRFHESPSFDISDRIQATLSEPWMKQAQQAVEARRSIELRLTWDE